MDSPEFETMLMTDPSATRVLDYSRAAGWSVDAPLSALLSGDGRVAQYVDWCLTYQRPFSQAYPLFLADQPDKVFCRILTFSPLSADSLQLTLGPLSDYADTVPTQHLQSEQHRARMIVEKTGVGTWHLDLVKDELLWDKQMYRLYDIDPDAFSGDYDAWRRSLHPDDYETSVRAFEDAINGTRDFDVEFRIVDRYQNIKHIQAKAEVLRDASGRALSIAGFNLDITQRKQLEQAGAEQLKINVHQSKLAAIGELAAGIGHEINNPLGIIVGHVEQLLNSENVALTHRASLETVMQASERIKAIVSGLRTFVHPEDSKRVFSLTQVVEESIQMVRQIYALEGVSLAWVNASDAALFVEGRRGRIQQVIMSLLSNARDATQDCPDRQIKIAMAQRNNLVELSVADNGTGMAPVIASRIFEMFFTTKPQGKGTGIGLSISQSIAAEHDGTLTVSSTEGQGSVFTLTLPLSVQAATTAETVPMSAEPGSKPDKLHLYVVDDEAGILELLDIALRRVGHDVRAFPDAAGALAAFRDADKPVDVIISDLQMPGMSGMTLLQEIRATTNAHQPHFVAITGGVTADWQKASDALADGVDSVLYKPFRMKDVTDLIDSLASD